MQKILTFALAIGVIAFIGSSYRAKREESQFLASALKSGGAALERAGIPQDCFGKRYCITAFIAPWCEACNFTIPAFRSLKSYLEKNRSDVGFGLVIGAASPSENKQKKIELSDIESYTDDEQAIMKRRGIKAFPTWVVIDNQGAELFRKPLGLALPNEESVRSFLSQMLGR